jgi:hypothetical protein
MLFSDCTFLKMNIQTVWSEIPFGLKTPHFDASEGYLAVVLSSLSTIASLLTIRNIMKSTAVTANLEVRTKKIRSTIKITLLNAGNLVYVIAVVIAIAVDHHSYAFLAMQTVAFFVPVLLSTYNPVIYLVLTKNIFHRS